MKRQREPDPVRPLSIAVLTVVFVAVFVVWDLIAGEDFRPLRYLPLLVLAPIAYFVAYALHRRRSNR